MEQDFYKQIEASTAHRPIRDLLCGEVLSNPELFSVLMETTLNCNDKSHYKACWILELVLENNIHWLAGYLERFTVCLNSYKHEGAIRSVSKICLFAARQQQRAKLTFLTPHQEQLIIEACLDWLIKDTKVASKAYAMRALYIFGKQQQWIHDELRHILPQGFPDHSPAYKAAAKEILKKI
jgi:hypothetical protein